MMEGLTPAQAAVLQAPYANRLDRPILTDAEERKADGDGQSVDASERGVVMQSRSAEKKAWDAAVFSSKYF